MGANNIYSIIWRNPNFYRLKGPLVRFQYTAKSKKSIVTVIFHCKRDKSTRMITLKNCARNSEYLPNEEKMLTFPILHVNHRTYKTPVFVPLYFVEWNPIKCQIRCTLSWEFSISSIFLIAPVLFYFKYLGPGKPIVITIT